MFPELSIWLCRRNSLKSPEPLNGGYGSSGWWSVRVLLWVECIYYYERIMSNIGKEFPFMRFMTQFLQALSYSLGPRR